MHVDVQSYVWCDRDGSIVRTDWRAVMTVENGGVAKVEAVLSLTGP